VRAALSTEGTSGRWTEVATRGRRDLPKRILHISRSATADPPT